MLKSQNSELPRITGRLGRPPAQRNIPCACHNTCPDILALDTGDFAIIGKDVTAEFHNRLPNDAGCGPDERIILIPREVLLAAKADIPNL
jgi:hypothetical protein